MGTCLEEDSRDPTDPIKEDISKVEETVRLEPLDEAQHGRLPVADVEETNEARASLEDRGLEESSSC